MLSGQGKEGSVECRARNEWRKKSVREKERKKAGRGVVVVNMNKSGKKG